jgi:hypothetical protein
MSIITPSSPYCTNQCLLFWFPYSFDFFSFSQSIPCFIFFGGVFVCFHDSKQSRRSGDRPSMRHTRPHADILISLSNPPAVMNFKAKPKKKKWKIEMTSQRRHLIDRIPRSYLTMCERTNTHKIIFNNSAMCGGYPY